MSTKKKCYYEVLGLQKSASEDEIKRAYKKLALKFHPDRHANATDKEKEELTKKFQELVEAYEVLSNPEKKTKYDKFGHTEDMQFSGFEGANIEDIFKQFFSRGGGSSSYSFKTSGGQGSTNFGGFSGFDGNFFDDIRGGHRMQSDFEDMRRPQKKSEVEFPLALTLDECFSGCIKRRKLTRQFLNGKKETKILEMNVLAGMKAKSRFNFKGYGDEYLPGRYQDISFVLEYKPSDFKVVNCDLIYELKMDFKKYIRGESVTIALPGNRKLVVNCKNVQNIGDENVFVGYGMSKKHGIGTGDLRLILKLTNASLNEPIKI